MSAVGDDFIEFPCKFYRKTIFTYR